MKKQVLSLIVLFFLLTFMATIVVAQPKQPSRTQAMPGDSVDVCKPSKGRQACHVRKICNEIFWAGASKLSEDEQKPFRLTRILHPVAPEADGTYSYICFIDPVVKGGNYDITSLLTKMYGEAKAKEHQKLWDESVAGEQKSYRVVQSRH